MFIRVFIQAHSKAEAEKHLEKLIGLGEKLQIKLNVINFEPYWKFEDSFQIEMNGPYCNEEQHTRFLDGIETKWSTFPDSYLASNTMEDCSFLLEGLELIEIFPTED